MPGFDESLEIPPHLEPPRLDADETLPNMLHPSYPFGRPVGLGKMKGKGLKGGIGNLLLGRGGLGMSSGDRRGRGQGQVGEEWEELDVGGLVEIEKGKEVPPGMAVSLSFPFEISRSPVRYGSAIGHWYDMYDVHQVWTGRSIGSVYKEES